MLVDQIHLVCVNDPCHWPSAETYICPILVAPSGAGPTAVWGEGAGLLPPTHTSVYQRPALEAARLPRVSGGPG